MKESKVLLLNGEFDLKDLDKIKEKYMAVICLFWAAPSTKKLISEKLNAECYSLEDIIKNYMEWGKKDYYFIGKIIKSGLKYKGIYWRDYLAEPLYLESSIWLQIKTIQFIDNLRKKYNIKIIIIDNIDKKFSPTFSQILSNYKNLSYNQLSNKTQETSKPGIFNKLREQFYEAYFSKDLKIPFINFIEAKDKLYKYRTFLGKLKKKKISKGNITFFSSYTNNSGSLSCLINLMPCPVNWIISTYSAHKGLPKNSNYQWIWQFSSSKNKKANIKKETEKLNIDKKEKDYKLIKLWLENSETWKNWKDFEFSNLKKLTQYWENYLDKAKPKLIVMANQWGIEGWFTKIAKKRGIPVLQIMHGLRAGYLHTQTPIISDYMTVYGKFWKNIWIKNQHSKIKVYNPNIIEIKKKTGKKPNLTFFLWHLKGGDYNRSEFIDGFIHIFHKLLKKEYKVTISCHPRANPSYFLERWKNFYGTVPSNISFIKEELSKVLEKTDLALMFMSTCILDCMLNKIPVVTPGRIDFGWIDFGFNKEIKKIKGVYLAEDFKDLENKVEQWLKNPPAMNEKQTEYFVQSPEKNKEEFRTFVKNLIKKRSKR